MQENYTYKEKIKFEDLYLKCIDCKQEVHFDEVEEDDNPRCSSCQGVLGVKQNQKKNPNKPLVRTKVNFSSSKGVDIIEDEQGLDILVNVFQNSNKTSTYFLLFFTIVWNAIIFAFPFNFVLLFHMAAGLFMMYHTASRLTNKINIKVRKGVLSISEGPISFSPRKEYFTKDIDQFYVSRYVSHTENNRATYSYSLMMRLKSGRQVVLHKSENLRTNFYLEQEIENYLGIQDVHVRGEYNPSKFRKT